MALHPPASLDGALRWLPGIAILKGYQAAWLPRDLAAGLVLTSMLVPVGIAYAEASGVGGVYGLYATIVPLLAYALWRRDPVFILGQGMGLFVYTRNLILIRRHVRSLAEAGA